MISEMHNLPDEEPRLEASPSGTHRIFLGASGLRSGWKVILFSLMTVAPAIAFRTELKRLGYRQENRFLIFEPTALLLLLGAMWVMSRIEKKSFGAFGLQTAGFTRTLGFGLCIGLLSLGLLLGSMAIASVYWIGPLSLHGFLPLTKWALIWTLVFTLVALMEELLWRGYALYALTRGIGFWPAASLLSLFFAAAHLQNPGETRLGILSVAVIGLVLAYSVRKTGALWWAIGFHFSWDWAQTYLFGVPDSGMIVCCQVFSGRILPGREWLSGGTAGPEGSVLALAVAALVALVLKACFRRKMPMREELAA
jgi:membrane protease YdiL (CAAX protease family)